MILFTVFCIVTFFIIYYYYNTQGKTTLKDSSNYSFFLLDNISNEYKKKLRVGTRLDLWCSPIVEGEIRAYIEGYNLGEGLIAILNDDKLYELLNSFNAYGKPDIKNKPQFKIVAINQSEIQVQPLTPSMETRTYSVPNELKIPRVDNDEYSISIGDWVNLWRSTKNRNEIRVYLFGNGYVMGEGLISIFQSKELYNYLLVQEKKEEKQLSCKVANYSQSSIILTIKEEVHSSLLYDEEADREKFIKKLSRGTNKKDKTVRLDFECTKRLTPKRYNKRINIKVDFGKYSFTDLCNKLFDYNHSEKYQEWLNTIIWLELDNEKISKLNTSKHDFIEEVVRFYNNGYRFRAEIDNDNLNNLTFELNLETEKWIKELEEEGEPIPETTYGTPIFVKANIPKNLD